MRTFLRSRLVIASAGLGGLVALWLALSAPVFAAPFCSPGQQPQFTFGFALLKSVLGPKMGDPTECEHFNPDNGDSLQQTTTGLSFYRKRTNTPTFTNGFEHWAWTASGLVTWTGSSIDPPPESGVATASAPSNSPRITTEELVTRNQNAILRIVNSEGCGSGFIVTSDGYAVTNQHVVGGDRVVTVQLIDGRQFAAQVLALSEVNDMALLQLPAGAYTYVRFGASATLPLGGDIAALGHPMTIEGDRPTCSTGLTVTRGVLSNRTSFGGVDYLQTDAAINPGNSGGAAFNVQGAFVGIPTLKFSGEVLPGSRLENVSLLIPSDRARPIIDDWIVKHRGDKLPALPQPTPTPEPTATPGPTATPTPPPTPQALISSTGIATGDDCAGAGDRGVQWAGSFPGNPLPAQFCYVVAVDWWPLHWTISTRWVWPTGTIDWTEDLDWCNFPSGYCRDGYLKSGFVNPQGLSMYAGTLSIDLYVNGRYVRTDTFVVK